MISLGRRTVTLKTIRKYLMHSFRPIDYLSIDIEGDELSVLEQLLADRKNIQDIKQIGMEIRFQGFDEMNRFQNIIKRIEASGFVRFFFRLNYLRKNIYQIAWFNANYSLMKSHPGSSNGWVDELMLNNKLPPIVFR